MSVGLNNSQPIVMGKPSTMNDHWQLNLYQLLQRAAIIQPNSEILTVINDGNEMHAITYQAFNKLCNNLAFDIKNKLGVKLVIAVDHSCIILIVIYHYILPFRVWD